MAQKGFKIIGHRGYGPTPASLKGGQDNGFLPENSLAAFAHALDLGADGIECDVYLSGDHIPMVIHDDEVEQHAIPRQAALAAGKKISCMTQAEIAAFDIGGGHKIPTLAALFELAFRTQDRRVILNLDIKDPTCVAAVTALMRQHADALAAHDVIISSYDWDILRAFRAGNPAVMLVPAIKSKILFGAENLGPGYVPLVDHYQDSARGILEALNDDIGIAAYDTTTTDFKPALATWAGARGLGLQISTANARVDADSTDYTILRTLKHLADSGQVPYVICKVDEPDRVREALYQDA